MVANQGNGVCFSTADPITVTPMPLDIVLVPPPAAGTPTPFVNTAQLGDATNVVESVCVNGIPVVIKTSVIPRSSGAPPNAIKGVTSRPPANNECKFVTGSGTVHASGYPLIRHRDTTTQDAGNCPGAVKLSEAFSLDGSGLVLDPDLSLAEKEAIVENLEKLAERPRSRELLDQMRSDYQGRLAAGGPANPTTISSNTPSGAPCPTTDAAASWTGPLGNLTNGVGNPPQVQFDPANSLNVPGYGPAMPPELVLAHELVHALHISAGTLLMGYSTGTMPSGAPAPDDMHDAEQQAMGIGTQSNARLAEARFAEERGMPVRQTHGPSEGFFPDNATPADRAPEGYATGSGGKGFVYCNE
jgi:hypothetical protein